MIERSKEYNEGYEAFENDDDEDACPYETDSKEAKDWLEGWNDAAVNEDLKEDEDEEDE